MPLPSEDFTEHFVDKIVLVGAVLAFHGSGPWILLIGAAGVLYVMYNWWRDVIGESHAVIGPRAFIRTRDYAFSMQTRPSKNRGENISLGPAIETATRMRGSRSCGW